MAKKDFVFKRPPKFIIHYRNPKFKLNLFILFILSIRKMISNNYSIYNINHYDSKSYFFILLKRLVFCNFISLTRLSFYFFSYIRNYKLLRFFEMSYLNINKFIKFRYNFFFRFNYTKKIYKFDKFFIKSPLFYLICLHKYLEHFRIFKYNEYLRKIPEGNLFFELNFHKKGYRYYTGKRFFFSFLKRRILIYYINRHRKKDYIFIIKGNKPCITKLLTYTDISLSFIYILVFKFFRKIFRIYYLYFCYIIYTWFYFYLRDFVVHTSRFPTINYLRVLNRFFHLPIWCILRRSFIRESYFFNFKMPNKNIYSIISLDAIPFDRTTKYYFLEYFSKMFNRLYHYLNRKYKSSKRRPRKFTARRQLFMLWFRVLISFYHFDFLSDTSVYQLKGLKFLKQYNDLFSWVVFHRKTLPFDYIDYYYYTLYVKIDRILFHYRRFHFQLSSLYSIKHLQKSNWGHPSFFLKKIVIDFFFKFYINVISYLSFLKKINMINRLLYKEYMFNKFFFIHILKVSKFWKYFMYNYLYYKEYYPKFIETEILDLGFIRII